MKRAQKYPAGVVLISFACACGDGSQPPMGEQTPSPAGTGAMGQSSPGDVGRGSVANSLEAPDGTSRSPQGGPDGPARPGDSAGPGAVVGGPRAGGSANAGDRDTAIPAVSNRSSWTSFGGDLGHTRSSPTETIIGVDEVADLSPAFDISAPGVTATPALYEGIIYWADWGGIVHATDLVTQTEIWSLNRADNTGGYVGSPAVTERMVYVANRNGLVSGIDRETGMVSWEHTIEAGSHLHIWSSPVVADEDNVLMVGVGGLGTRDNSAALPRSQLQSFRGRLQALDSTTGEPLWEFEVTPMPSGAGVSVWSSASLDTTRKLAFFGTGNNYYRPVSDMSDSLIAVNYLTGEYAWHAQYTEDDAWTYANLLGGGVDGDVGATPNLFSIDGRDVVGVGDKQGRYFLHDRETGDLIWSQKLTRGGYQGGVMAPAAFADGIVYVVSNNNTASSTVFALDAADEGSPLWEANLPDPTFGGPAVGNGVLYVGDTGGNLRGYNAMTGQELWRARLPGGKGGGNALVDGVLLTGWGYHFSESRREPLRGGLVGFSLGGEIMLEEGMMSDCIESASVTAEPTFTNVYQGVLCQLGCDKVCHSTSAEAGLTLAGKDIAYMNLTNVAAKGVPCVGKGTLVTPGSPDMSLLYSKLTATPACGVSMPPGGEAADSPVTSAMLEAVRGWVAADAPNN